MTRAHLQNVVLLTLIALLLLGIAYIYRTFQQRAPPNLEGHIAVEGAMTANPP